VPTTTAMVIPGRGLVLIFLRTATAQADYLVC